MNTPEWMREQLQALILTKPRIFVAAAGAGASAQATLWSEPGASAFFAGAAFPYNAEEMTRFLGYTPTSFASEETARAMAMMSYFRAIDLGDPGRKAIGVGLTASVASLTEHRGDHRIHVAVMTADRVVGWTQRPTKRTGFAARGTDGWIADNMILSCVFRAAGIGRWEDEEPKDWSTEARAEFFNRPLWTSKGQRTFSSTETRSPLEWKGDVLFPGSFNPPHAGHLRMAQEVMKRVHVGRVLFSICATPPHKNALSLAEMLRRAKILEGEPRLFTEGDPLYLDKARAFPGHEMILGADTLERMMNPSWGVTPEVLLEEFRMLHTRFYLFGRETADGTFQTADETIEKFVPDRYQVLFRPCHGRWNISSTGIRARAEDEA
jgi:nicotinic acid mononucleotide adenylyltransferase